MLTNSLCSQNTKYPPPKPSVQRQSVLGDVTNAMRTSWYTWIWQAEMKELELAYTGNKRNLFCIENPFVCSGERPPTPPPEEFEDPESEEYNSNVQSFYIDTLGDRDERIPPPGMMPDSSGQLPDDQQLIEASYHDEDYRLPPTARIPEPSAVFGEVTHDVDLRSDPSALYRPSPFDEPDPAISSSGQRQDIEPPKPLSDPRISMDKADSSTAGGGDGTSGKPVFDIAKMLNIIKMTSNQNSQKSAGDAAPQSDFWSNLIGSTYNSQGTGASQPTRRDPRDPRNRRPTKADGDGDSSSDAMSSELTAFGAFKEEPTYVEYRPGVFCDWRLHEMPRPVIDYSRYYAAYSSSAPNDAKLKNDPRLQKFFANNKAELVVEQLSKITPLTSISTRSSTITSSTIASLMSTTSGAAKKSVIKPEPDGDKPSSDTPASSASSLLPTLPPLTLTLPKPPSANISLVPPPPPIMSPFELIAGPKLTLPPLLTPPPLQKAPDEVTNPTKTIVSPTPTVATGAATAEPEAPADEPAEPDEPQNIKPDIANQEITEISTSSADESESQSAPMPAKSLTPIKSDADSENENMVINEERASSPDDADKSVHSVSEEEAVEQTPAV